MHLYGYSTAGVDGTFACYALRAPGVTADVVRGHALEERLCQ